MGERIKRLLAFFIAAAMLMGMGGCAKAPKETQTMQTAQEVTAEEPETQVPAQTEALYLTVSSITFSLVGDSEDIYLGVVPREMVTWSSDDEGIVRVDGGILTAVGVGTTTIHASYKDLKVSCTAGCLAQSQGELEALSNKILSEPKRLIPEVDLSEPCCYFDNAAIVGDSITYGMMQYENKPNYLGDILFLARGGVSMMGFVQHVKSIIYQGKSCELEDAVSQAQVERVYFLMGSNDVGAKYTWETMMENWSIMLGRIWEKSPDAQIVMFSSIPKFSRNLHAGDAKEYNEMTREYNRLLRQFAKENGCGFIDLYAYTQDHMNRMPAAYQLDDYHLNEAGCLNWMKIMRYYAQYELDGGILE